MRAARVLIFAALLPAAFAQGAGISARPDVAGSIRVFDAWLNEQMAYRDLPGVAVGVVHDQQLVWSRGYGFSDRERRLPVTSRTLFRMASHTKLFTTTAILQLRDAGKLRLDDPVSRYLPWFRVKPASDSDPPISIEELLTHTSGLPREAAAPYWTTFQFPSADEIRRTVPLQSAAYSPQVRWKYSNLAFTLAGMIVEEVSGERYADYVMRHVLRPPGDVGQQFGLPSGAHAGSRGWLRPANARWFSKTHAFHRLPRHRSGRGPQFQHRGHGPIRVAPVSRGKSRWQPDPFRSHAPGDAQSASSQCQMDERERAWVLDCFIYPENLGTIVVKPDGAHGGRADFEPLKQVQVDSRIVG